MAKDNLGLLTEISNQLKKLNQQSIRQDLQNKEYQERQLAQAAGGETAGDQGPGFIDAAEDFKRRAKASIFSTKLSEKITDSGKRAKDTVKENKEKEKDRKREKKDRKLQALRTADKKVGLSTVVDVAKKTNVIELDELGVLTLIKVNTDSLVHMLGGIRTHLGMSNKAAEKARKAAIKAAANVKRDKEEERREADKKEDKVIKMGKLGTFMKDGPQSAGGNNLFGLLLGGLIAGVGLAVKSMIDGFKAGGIKGALKKLFFGNGEGGLGNAIAGAFKVGGTFATAGLLIGGPVGALVGGLIGMAVGAFTGYFGADAIGEKFSAAGDFVGEAVDGIISRIKTFGMTLAHAIYKPAQKGNVAANDTKAQFFGREVNWTLTGIGEKIAEAWNGGFEWLKEKISNIAKSIYDPDTGVILGGVFNMPDWFGDVKESVMKVWNGLKNFGNSIKLGVIGLLPDWLTDRLGMTIDGRIPASEMGLNVPGSSVGGNVSTALNNPGMGLSDIAYERSLGEVINRTYGMGNNPTQEAVRTMENLLKFGNQGSNVANAHMARVMSSYGERKGIDLTATERLRQRDMNLAMDGYGMRNGGVNITTDASNNTGAVIVNNNYMDSGPSASSVDIHTHMEGTFPGGREIPWHLRGGYN